MCSRKEFRIAAKQIQDIQNRDNKKAVAIEFIRFFENTNERFDRNRFWIACGLDNYLLEL